MVRDARERDREREKVQAAFNVPIDERADNDTCVRV